MCHPINKSVLSVAGVWCYWRLKKNCRRLMWSSHCRFKLNSPAITKAGQTEDTAECDCIWGNPLSSSYDTLKNIIHLLSSDLDSPNLARKLSLKARERYVMKLLQSRCAAQSRVGGMNQHSGQTLITLYMFTCAKLFDRIEMFSD